MKKIILIASVFTFGLVNAQEYVQTTTNSANSSKSFSTTGKVAIGKNGTAGQVSKLHVEGQGSFGYQGLLYTNWANEQNWGGDPNKWAGYIGFNAHRANDYPKDYYTNGNPYTNMAAFEGSNDGFRWMYKDLNGGGQNNISTNLSEYMRLTKDGKLGIGTANPEGILDVYGAQNPSMVLKNAANKKLFIALADCNGCHGSFAKPGDAVFRVLGGGDMHFDIPGTNSNRKISFNTAGDQIMTIQEVGTSGKVGVGTTNFPASIGSADLNAYKLFVKGGVLTEEVRVRTGWADYVFDGDYKLKSLQEVEQYIQENGYLPNVPSAKQVEKEGIELGDITRVQQEKIEELTLYTIQQQKEIDELKTLVKSLVEKK